MVFDAWCANELRGGVQGLVYVCVCVCVFVPLGKLQPLSIYSDTYHDFSFLLDKRTETYMIGSTVEFHQALLVPSLILCEC